MIGIQVRQHNWDFYLNCDQQVPLYIYWLILVNENLDGFKCLTIASRGVEFIRRNQKCLNHVGKDKVYEMSFWHE